MSYVVVLVVLIRAARLQYKKPLPTVATAAILDLGVHLGCYR